MIGNIARRKCDSCGLIKSERVFPKLDDGTRSDTCKVCVRPTEKECADCHLTKPLEDFTHNYQRGDLRSNVCRVCQRIRGKKYRKRAPHPSNARARSWELAEVRIVAMAAQKRNPDADYFKSYRGVRADYSHPCSVLAGCVALPSIISHGGKPETHPGIAVEITFGDGLDRSKRVA